MNVLGSLPLLCVTLLTVDYFDRTCGQEVCLFGSDPDCYFPCHCGNDTHPEPCDSVTGKDISRITVQSLTSMLDEKELG